MTLTGIAVFCRFSDRRLAVTITGGNSLGAEAEAVAAAGGAGAGWASAEAAAAAQEGPASAIISANELTVKFSSDIAIHPLRVFFMENCRD
jgi:hypothetical protein